MSSDDRVVVCVRFRPTLLACEVVTRRTILVCREPALSTPLRRVRRSDLLHRDSDSFCLVFDVLVERSERPFVAPRRVRAVAEMGEVLERDHITIVPEYFV